MKESDPILRELSAIKKLLILALLKDGFTQSQVAAALEIDRTGVGRMFPTGTLTGLSKRGDGNE
jgi:DNA-binding transcriptional regulator LsrR (DeoR family)